MADVVIHALDPRRFPWVCRGKRADRGRAGRRSPGVRRATRNPARRNEEKQRQEDTVKKALTDAGLTEVETRKIAISGQQNRGFLSPGVTGAHAPVLQRSERRGRCHAGCHSGGQRSGAQSPVENDQTTSRSERRGLGGRAKRTGT